MPLALALAIAIGTILSRDEVQLQNRHWNRFKSRTTRTEYSGLGHRSEEVTVRILISTRLIKNLNLKVKANKGLSILQCSINGEARKWDVKFHIVSRTILG